MQGSSSGSGGGGGSAPPPPASAVLPAGRRVRAAEDAPLRKLTTGLLATYKAINNKYYAAKKARQQAAAAAGGGGQAAAASTGSSDYVMTAGDVLGGRYRVTESAFWPARFHFAPLVPRAPSPPARARAAASPTTLSPLQALGRALSGRWCPRRTSGRGPRLAARSR